jgi:hypothetical protein
MAKDSVIQIRVTDDERIQIEASAAADDRSVSSWARRVLKQAAGRSAALSLREPSGRGAAPSEAAGDRGGEDEGGLRYEPMEGE